VPIYSLYGTAAAILVSYAIGLITRGIIVASIADDRRVCASFGNRRIRAALLTWRWCCRRSPAAEPSACISILPLNFIGAGLRVEPCGGKYFGSLKDKVPAGCCE